MVSIVPSIVTYRNPSSIQSDARGSRSRFLSFLRPRFVFMTIVSPRSSYHITVCCGLPLAFTVASTAKRSSSRNVRTSSLSCKCTKTPSLVTRRCRSLLSTVKRDERRDLDILAPRKLPPTPRRLMPSVSLAVDRAPLIVALDAGTSSVRALAFDNLGQAIGETEEQLPYRLETTPDGGATFPAEALFDLTV